MASIARQSFDANIADIDRLLEIHLHEGGDDRGRRYDLEVLNKSAIVLITAYWEAYCEDVAEEGLAHILRHANSADALPENLRKTLAKEIKSALNELEVWKIADLGWKTYLNDRLERLREERNRRLNTPKSSNIDALFLDAIGIPKMSSSWKWKKMSSAQATAKLDKYVSLRGAIAHRGKHSESVKKSEVEDFLGFTKKLAALTGGLVNKHVKAISGTSLW
jgi:hypothetical protein